MGVFVEFAPWDVVIMGKIFRIPLWLQGEMTAYCSGANCATTATSWEKLSGKSFLYRYLLPRGIGWVPAESSVGIRIISSVRESGFDICTKR